MHPLHPILAAIFPLVLCFPALALTPQEIVQKADDVRGPDGTFSFQVRVKDFQGSSLIRENVYKVHSKDMKFTLIETIFPERLSGRKLLMAGGLWLYLPTLKRPTRVGMQQRLTGEVANGDIARAKFNEDYQAKLEGREKLGKTSAFRLLLVAKEKTAAYRKVRLWVAEKGYVPLKAEFFALSGKKLKTSEYSGLESVFGKQRLTQVVIKDAIQPTRQSHLKFFAYRHENLDAKFFNKEALAD